MSGSPQWRRMRFTVAHEIAHILLCDLLADDPVALRAAGDHAHWKQVERICNAAAAELLMPADSFRQAALETGIQPAGLRELYDRYLVSWETLLLRFTEVFDLSLVRFSTYSPNPTARRTLRALRNARGDWWLPEHLTSRHLIPDVVRGAGEQGWAASPSILVDVGSQRRRPAAMAVHLPTAHAIKSTRIPRLDGFDAPDEPELPFEVALFMQSAGKADWKTLVEM